MRVFNALVYFFGEEIGRTEMSKQKFWIVVGNGGPVVRYPSLDLAKAEAARLAKFYSVDFTVMESVKTVTKADFSWEPNDAYVGESAAAMAC